MARKQYDTLYACWRCDNIIIIVIVYSLFIDVRIRESAQPYERATNFTGSLSIDTFLRLPHLSIADWSPVYQKHMRSYQLVVESGVKSEETPVHHTLFVF